MKKAILSALMLLVLSTTYAEAGGFRPCRVWKGRPHHRYCARR